MKSKTMVWALIGVCSVVSLTSCGKKEEVPDVDMSAFETPAGFQWEGTYMDANSTTTLSITKDGRKKYTCVINTSDEDITHIDSYEFTAEEADVGLAYKNGTHTVYNLPDFENDPTGLVDVSEAYTDGTGSIYYLDENLYWIDDVNDAGREYVFRPLEESDVSEEESSEN